MTNGCVGNNHHCPELGVSRFGCSVSCRCGWFAYIDGASALVASVAWAEHVREDA